MLLLIYLIAAFVWVLANFSLVTTLQDTLWENAACRIPALFLVFSWSWAFTIYACEQNNFDLKSLMGGNVLPSSQLFQTTKWVTYAFCTLHLLDLLFTARFELSLVRFDFHLLLVVLFVMALLNPFDLLHSPSRFSLLTALSDVALFPYSEASSSGWHILIADYTTSLSKVLADSQVMICLGLNTISSGIPNVSVMFNSEHRRVCYDNMVTPFIIFCPFFWRICQCLRLYKTTQDVHHVYKAIKYATTLPVIFCSAIRRHYSDDPLVYLYFTRAWILFTIIHTSISFYWDLRYDWGFLEPPVRATGQSPNKGRCARLLELPGAAVIGLVLNFCLRGVWALKLGLPMFFHGEFGVFIFEVLETVRRSVWFFYYVRYHNIRHPSKPSELSMIA